MIYGYARVSTQDQDLDAQVDLLRNAGAVRVYAEKVSGVAMNRPELGVCLDDLERVERTSGAGGRRAPAAPRGVGGPATR